MTPQTTRQPRTAVVRVLNLHKAFRVSKSYAEMLRHPFRSELLVALDQVSFSVERGCCLGILGPNGAGKTTLMKILSTLIRPTSGDAWIEDIHLEKKPEAAKKMIGCVISDERSFFWRLTGVQNLRFFSTLNNIPSKIAKSRIEKLLELTELKEDIHKPFQKYSSGMKQKLAIARALLNDPKILLFDEPSKNLDPLFKERFLSFLRETILDKMQKTVLLATHSTKEAQCLCDDILVLHKGRVLLHQPVESINHIDGIFKKSIFT